MALKSISLSHYFFYLPVYFFFTFSRRDYVPRNYYFSFLFSYIYLTSALIKIVLFSTTYVSELEVVKNLTQIVQHVLIAHIKETYPEI